MKRAPCQSVSAAVGVMHRQPPAGSRLNSTPCLQLGLPLSLQAARLAEKHDTVKSLSCFSNCNFKRRRACRVRARKEPRAWTTAWLELERTLRMSDKVLSVCIGDATTRKSARACRYSGHSHITWNSFSKAMCRLKCQQAKQTALLHRPVSLTKARWRVEDGNKLLAK